MQERTVATNHEVRRAPRVELDGEVAIRFDGGTILGSGENVSEQGVFFTAAAALPVTVHVAGRGEIRGELVRLETIGDGRIGIAVRFHEVQPEVAS